MSTDIEKAVALERSAMANYEWALVPALKLKRYDEVFDIMERSHARAMLDLLGNRDYSMREARLSADERELLLLKTRMDEIKDAIEKERTLGRSEEMASLQRSLVLTEDTRFKIQQRADIARREILTPRQMKPISAQEAQQLIGEDTLICTFEGIYETVITKDVIISREMRGHSFFEKLITDFRAAIDQRGSQARSLVLETDGKATPDAVATADAKILAIGQEMYRIIFEPVEKYFSKTSDRIYIVYDRKHPLVPYQALHDGRQYLAEKYTLVYAPSMSVLKKCMERRHPPGNKLLALGNPDLGNPDYNLAYAEDEVKKLAEIYPDSRILTGAEASEAAVQLLASDADILHFACHGVIDEDDPKKSHLRLAPDKDNDGYLTAEEIMDLQLQCSLVTLSACDTGRGRILMGGDILGLTRAWIYAGTPSVLASLWKVDDRATSRLMTAFYENLKTHDKAKSLQLAQLDMIKEGLSPFYWAAFCLYGDYK
jgi:CHAT domain-containing protein